jgi:hypothetical protein
VDFAAKQKTHYLADGTTHTVPMILDPGPIAAEFNGAELVAAIRGAQADTVRYPEFVKRSTAAGVIGYWAFLTGKRVIYFGRKGEQHIEEFPKPRRVSKRGNTMAISAVGHSQCKGDPARGAKRVGDSNAARRRKTDSAL